MISIKDSLIQLADEDYKNFHQKLIPNIAENRVLGVRTPILRKFANTKSCKL